jgi:hypothetical protein
MVVSGPLYVSAIVFTGEGVEPPFANGMESLVGLRVDLDVVMKWYTPAGSRNSVVHPLA